MTSVSSPPIQSEMYVSFVSSLLYRAKCVCLLCVHFMYSEIYVFRVFTSRTERNLCVLCVFTSCTERNVCVLCVFTSCTKRNVSSECSLPLHSEMYVSSDCSLPVRTERFAHSNSGMTRRHPDLQRGS